MKKFFRKAPMLVAVLFGVCSLSITVCAYYAYSFFEKVSVIQTAEYEVLVSVVPQETEEGSIEQYTFSGEEGENGVKFQIIGSGTASTGYCEIVLNGQSYVTQNMPVGDSEPYVVNIKGNAGDVVRFVPHWGMHDVTDEAVIINSGEVVGTYIPVATPSPTPSPTSSITPSPTPSITPSPTPSASPSATPSPTPSATPSATPSPTPSATPSPTPSASPSAESSAEPSESPSAEPSESSSAEPSESPSAEPSESPSAEPSESPSAEPSESPSAEPSESPSAEPSESPSAEPSEEPSIEPSLSPSEAPSTEPSASQ